MKNSSVSLFVDGVHVSTQKVGTGVLSKHHISELTMLPVYLILNIIAQMFEVFGGNRPSRPVRNGVKSI